MYCFKCGAQIADDSLFCQHCGADQRAVPQAQPVQQPGYQQTVSHNTAPAGPGVGTVVKAAKGGASALKWVIVAVALISVAVFVVVQFDLLNIFKTDEDLIRERVEAFEAAYNNTDWDAMMECMDSQTQAMLELTMSFADGLLSEMTGYDFGISDMLGLGSFVIGEDFCRMEVLDIQIDGDYAQVRIVMSTNMYGKQESEEVVLPMVKEGDNWYLSAAGELDDFFGFG